MKRLLPALLSLSLFAGISLRAAEVDAEDFRGLKVRVEGHDESIESLRAEVQRMKQEIAQLRAELQRLNTSYAMAAKSYATQEQVKELTRQLQEVEKNRAADKKQVLDAIDKLAKTITVPVVPVPEPAVKTPRPRTTESSETKPSGGGSSKPSGDSSANDSGPDLPKEYYEHTVAAGETLGVIVAEYNKSLGLKVTTAAVLKANPKLKDPKKLQVGQKLRIPAIK